MTTTTTTTTGASRQQRCSRRRICERQFSESFEILDFESFFASWSLDETVAIFGHLNAHPKENVGERDREDAVNNNNCEKVSTTSTGRLLSILSTVKLGLRKSTSWAFSSRRKRLNLGQR